uniref:Transmembrane protein 14C n=1 Tax=Hucho hucho TaxID=62062 RepID=A0A4W5JAX1_9TELE
VRMTRLAYSYAATVSARGLQKATSNVTFLVTGFLFGVLAGVGAYLMSQNPNNVYLKLGTSGTLAVVMRIRYLKLWKFTPAGLVTLAR